MKKLKIVLNSILINPMYNNMTKFFNLNLSVILNSIKISNKNHIFFKKMLEINYSGKC